MEVARFWARVRFGPKWRCWQWLGGTNGAGRGIARIGGQSLAASRWAWIILFGSPEPEMYVLHRCDNGLCCNPNHLFLGTQADNVRDMDAKGRRGKGVRTRGIGESHYAARLTDVQIAEIRQAVAAGGETHQRIADRYGVTRQYVGILAARLRRK